MTFAESYLEPALEPWLESSKNAQLKLFLKALGTMFALAQIIEGEGEDAQWGAILDPRPGHFPSQYNPQYLAQFVGVTLPLPTSTLKAVYEEDLTLIAEEQGFSRGTTTSIILAVKRGLKALGAAPRLLERQNASGVAHAYRFIIKVRGQDVLGSVKTTGNVTSASAKIKSIPTTLGMEAGDPVIALGFPPTATIETVNSNTEVTLNTTSSVTKTGVEVVVVSQTGLQTITNNVQEVKPAGLLWELLSGGIYKEAEEGYATYTALEGAFSTYAALEIGI